MLLHRPQVLISLQGGPGQLQVWWAVWTRQAVGDHVRRSRRSETALQRGFDAR